MKPEIINVIRRLRVEVDYHEATFDVPVVEETEEYRQKKLLLKVHFIWITGISLFLKESHYTGEAINTLYLVRVVTSEEVLKVGSIVASNLGFIWPKQAVFLWQPLRVRDQQHLTIWHTIASKCTLRQSQATVSNGNGPTELARTTKATHIQP